MRIYLPEDHTFVICAYKESQYLEVCISSLLTQSVKSSIVISTSTPNDFIRKNAKKYNLPLFVNPGKTGIAEDWNFALTSASTDLITLAHQDDIYEPCYVEEMLKAMNSANDPIFFSSDYAEFRKDKKVLKSRLLNIKRVMRLPMRAFPNQIAARRLSLAFGDPICCPSVTYVRDIILRHPFQSGLKASLDWQQWEVLSREKGSFVFCNKPLICHRIHEESETSRIINNYSRFDEDYQMFLKFWPKGSARILAKLYALSEKSNSVK